MTHFQEKIPVFILSYNDLASLRLCLRALVRRTLRAHRIVVVDNASTDPRLRRYLQKLGCLTAIQVIRKRMNLWVLGLNKTVREWAAGSGADSLFAVSDCDIVVPLPRDGVCWLSRLERSMADHACVGKLGLSLDLGYIKNRKAYRHTYERERFFMEGPRISNLVIAPVDTTMALYRKSMFITRLPLFIPPHQSLYRPYLYCCRTAPDFQARHLSWRFYGARSRADVATKLVCFGLVGATAVPAAYNAAPWFARWFYFVTQPLARIFWGFVVLLLQAAYVVRTFPRDSNEIQASRRA